MTPKDLLKTWLGANLPSAETLFRAPSYRIPLHWGKQQALLSFDKPITEILYAVQVAYGNDTVILGLAKTAECPDFNALVSARQTVDPDIQLAVVEAELQYTMLTLSPNADCSPKVLSIMDPQTPELKSGLPFHLVTADKQALIASGIIVPSATMINAWTNLDFLAPEDESVVTEPTSSAHATALRFNLPERPEPGDHVILPELKNKTPQDMPLTLQLDNGLCIAARRSGEHTLELQTILNPGQDTRGNAELVLGTANVTYHDLIRLLNGEQKLTVPLNPDLRLWLGGQPAARGILTELAQTPSFEIEEVNSDKQ